MLGGLAYSPERCTGSFESERFIVSENTIYPRQLVATQRFRLIEFKTGANLSYCVEEYRPVNTSAFDEVTHAWTSDIPTENYRTIFEWLGREYSTLKGQK